ncbi:peptide chain release factor 1 [bacterium]|nr:peptide chain release factor 1 [bacterium]
MFDKLDQVDQKYEQLNRLLSDPKVISDASKYREYAKSQAEIEKIVVKYREYKETKKRLEEAKHILEEESEDEELRELAKIEADGLVAEKEKLEKELKMLLLPKDPNDDKNIILEVRAGIGGEEAALFAGDLTRMYARYAESKGWKTEVISSHQVGSGGFKEIILAIQGQKVYSHLKYEMGVHRVQRVPVTEASGRIHTSAVTVAVLPEAEEVEVDIKPEDIRVDIFRSSGHGGQSVNTTDSAIRVTHLTTGLVVSCQDEKSQHKNKAKALRVLRARLLKKYQEEQDEQIAEDRRSQIGKGDRSEKIRTYNFPQNRVTDHRIGLTLHKLDDIISGKLDEVIDALIAYFKAEELKKVA